MAKNKLSVEEQQRRVGVANKVLSMFSRLSLSLRNGRVCVTFPWHNETKTIQWLNSSGNDFYPKWSHKYHIGGGTTTQATSVLVRWIKGQTVLPIGSWRYWCSETVNLASGKDIAPVLLAGGYPEEVTCVLCGTVLTGSFDWWSLNDVVGPSCSSHSGCRQKPLKP